jgi:hypothetical protein
VSASETLFTKSFGGRNGFDMTSEIDSPSTPQSDWEAKLCRCPAQRKALCGRQGVAGWVWVPFGGSYVGVGLRGGV